MDFDGAGAKQSRKDDRLPDETWFESWSGYHLPICYADPMPMMPVSARWDPMGPYGTPGAERQQPPHAASGGPGGRARDIPGPGSGAFRGHPGSSGAGACRGPGRAPCFFAPSASKLHGAQYQFRPRHFFVMFVFHSDNREENLELPQVLLDRLPPFSHIMERLFVKSTSAVLLCLRHKTPTEVIGLSFNRRVYIYDTTTLRHNSERMAVAAVAVAVENDTRSGRRCGCGAPHPPGPRPPARFLGGIRSHMVSYKFIVIGPSLGRRMAAECGGGWRRMAEDGDGWRRGGGAALW